MIRSNKLRIFYAIVLAGVIAVAQPAPDAAKADEAYQAGQRAEAAKADEATLVDKRNAMPCEYDAKHREFDFWIGEWDVADASGAPQGANSITKQESGCVLVEKWTSLGGSGGMSINFFDPGMQQWVQQWVSANGGFINIVGGVKDGSMVLVGTINGPGQPAPNLPFRGTWTPLDDGRVRQFFEQSNDAGKTWAPWFEGFYTRQSAE